ncbi:MAG: hypothetical protein RH862_05525 [Leptospiraceae bacterium]
MESVDQARKMAIAENTFLRDLSSPSLEALVQSGIYINLPEGSTLYRPGEQSQMLLIESGEGRMWIVPRMVEEW